MRRRLKTTKKTKKTASKPKEKKAVASKNVPEKKVDGIKKTGVEVRVLSKKKNKKEKKKVVLEVDREAELEKKLAKIKQEKQAKIKPKKVVTERQKTLQEVERHKQIIMWSGIIFFMVLITIFWVANTKRVVRESREQRMNEEKISSEWDELVDEISDKIVEMQSDLESIKSFEEGSTSTNDISTLPELAENQDLPKLSPEDYKKINEKIEPELKDKIRFIY